MKPPLHLHLRDTPDHASSLLGSIGHEADQENECDLSPRA